MEGIAALGQLDHLQQFLYGQMRGRSPKVISLSNRADQRFFTMVLLVLPRLWVSCTNTTISLAVDDPIIHRPYAWEAFQELQGQLPSRLGLRQLTLYEASGMPVGVALPDLTTLKLHRPLKNFRLGSGLKSVTELSLLSIGRKLCERILGHLGHQLDKLSVWVRDTLLVDRLFGLCPKLQVFYLTGFPLDALSVEDVEMLPTMSFLTEMGFHLEEAEDEESAQFEAGLLLRVLQAAPNLQKLHLLQMSVQGPQEEREICEALQQNSILQQLHTLFYASELAKWDFWDKEDEGRYQERLRMTHSVLHNMILHCPKLITYVNWDRD
jgi:hypothetical protein